MPSLKASIGDNHNISLDDACELIAVESPLDELGQPGDPVEMPRTIFCSQIGVSRAEFSAAGQLGMKPDLVLVVDSDEYDGEEKIAYNGKRFAVYRDYQRSDGFTELYCEVRSGVY